MNANARLSLYFHSEGEFSSSQPPQLARIKFICAEQKVHSIRSHSIARGFGTFRWTPASHALALFFVRALEQHMLELEFEPVLSGNTQSPAGSVVRLLKKRISHSLLDAFGTDVAGRSLLHKIILCSNYTRTTVGPAQIFLRKGLLCAGDIEVYHNEQLVSEYLSDIALLRSALQKSWKPGICLVSSNRKVALADSVKRTTRGSSELVALQ